MTGHPELENPFFLIALLIIAAGFYVQHLKNKNALRAREKDYLEKKQEMERQDEQSQTLLSILCHDLSTPLTVLEFSVSRLKPSPEASEKEVKAYTKISYALAMLKETLEKVRRLQETRLGKQPIKLEALDPVAIVDELVLLFEDRLSAKNLQINVESYSDNKRKLLADRSLLQTEVLSNILSNAIKFSPCNRNIDLCFLNDDDHFVIYIRDYGIGIPKELIPKLFEFGTSTHRLGTQAEKGTGLGLPVAKTCIQMMGGSIDVESYSYEPGISGPGTMFTLRFKTVDDTGPEANS